MWKESTQACEPVRGPVWDGTCIGQEAEQGSKAWTTVVLSPRGLWAGAVQVEEARKRGKEGLGTQA